MTQLDETTTRRGFLKIGSAVAMALPTALPALRPGSALAAGGELDEADPAAAELGYRKDTTQVDAARYPQHSPAQTCAGCRYYQGKATAEWAPCTIFSGKGPVHAKGWCAAYVAR